MNYSWRIRVLACHQLPRPHTVPPRPTQPGQARILTFIVKHGFAVIRADASRDGRKRPVQKTCTYGKPKSCAFDQLKPKRNLHSVAKGRVEKRGGGLRIGQDHLYKFYEVVIVDLSRKTMKIVWNCMPYNKYLELRSKISARRKCPGSDKGQWGFKHRGQL